MTDTSELLLRVSHQAQQAAGVLAACLGEQDIADAERVLGFVLPPLLRKLYLHVANGGFGPEYTLLPLVGAGRTATAEHRPLRDSHPACWPHGLLPILGWGCGMYAAVGCLTPDAPVLLFEPNPGPDDWADAWFLDSPSLTQWLTS